MRMTGLRRSGLNPSRLLLAAVFVCLLMLAGAAPSGSAQEAPDQTVTPSATDSTPQSFDTESASDTTPDSAPATSDAATRANSPASPSSDPAAIPTPATIQYWLVSNQPRMVAWGAWDAGLAKDSGAIPELLALANAWQPGASDEKYDGEYLPARDDRRDAMADVLDALLQFSSRACRIRNPPTLAWISFTIPVGDWRDSNTSAPRYLRCIRLRDSH
jgi:hypothetical protein